MRQNRLLLTVFLFLIFIIGCVSSPDSNDKENNQQDSLVCNFPYIKVGLSCCLDIDNNSICDADETAAELAVKTEITAEKTGNELTFSKLRSKLNTALNKDLTYTETKYNSNRMYDFIISRETITFKQWKQIITDINIVDFKHSPTTAEIKDFSSYYMEELKGSKYRLPLRWHSYELLTRDVISDLPYQQEGEYYKSESIYIDVFNVAAEQEKTYSKIPYVNMIYFVTVPCETFLVILKGREFIYELSTEGGDRALSATTEQWIIKTARDRYLDSVNIQKKTNIRDLAGEVNKIVEICSS